MRLVIYTVKVGGVCVFLIRCVYRAGIILIVKITNLLISFSLQYVQWGARNFAHQFVCH
jgi:hypothetical protein